MLLFRQEKSYRVVITHKNEELCHTTRSLLEFVFTYLKAYLQLLHEQHRMIILIFLDLLSLATFRNCYHVN